METTEAFRKLRCTDCGAEFDPAGTVGRCRDCGGILDPDYEYAEVTLSRETLSERPFASMWRYEELLPFDRETAVSMDEGATQLIGCPGLAEAWDVGAVYIKDEGRNPTGSFKDRGATAAVTAANEAGATDVALASAGNAGQAASAYSARAGLGAHVFLPSRASSLTKAMVDVHGADLTVVEGGISAAGDAFEKAIENHDAWYPVQTFVTPYRHEGKKTMYYEIVEQLDWEVPDHIVYPTGGGVGLVGMHKAAREFEQLGLTDGTPGYYAAQSDGCAPIVRAHERDMDRHEVWEDPETICGGVEIPDPGASPWILRAIRDSGGGAVATSDEDILDATLQVAREEGLEMGVTCAAAASGAAKLARNGRFESDDTVVLVNTATGNKYAEVARSHLSDK